jgi:hypothetical protein
MPSKSKNKGNAFEREVSEFLSNTYNESFLRVPSSGAFVGGKNTFRKSSLDEAQLQSKKGDIHPPDLWKYWNAECKSYADFPFHQLILGEVKILDKWIEQTLEVSDKDDLNIIFIKISHKGRWVVFEETSNFNATSFIAYKNWKFTSWDDFWTKQENIDLVKKYATGKDLNLLS